MWQAASDRANDIGCRLRAQECSTDWVGDPLAPSKAALPLRLNAPHATPGTRVTDPPRPPHYLPESVASAGTPPSGGSRPDSTAPARRLPPTAGTPRLRNGLHMGSVPPTVAAFPFPVIRDEYAVGPQCWRSTRLQERTCLPSLRRPRPVSARGPIKSGRGPQFLLGSQGAVWGH